MSEPSDPSKQNGKPEKLVDHYAGYYGDSELARWRELGAADKADDVIRLCTSSERTLDPGTVADIGCGDGAVIQALAERGFGRSFTGYEVSDSAIQSARGRRYARPARFEPFDGGHVPAPDRSFDLVLLSHVLEHVESPRQLLGEARRLGRYVFVEVPLELNLRTPRDFRWTSTGHVNLFNPTVLRHLVQSSGLRIVAERVTCSSPSVYQFSRPGLKGKMHWLAKRLVLSGLGSRASHVWTYHGCVLAEPVGD